MTYLWPRCVLPGYTVDDTDCRCERWLVNLDGAAGHDSPGGGGGPLPPGGGGGGGPLAPPGGGGGGGGPPFPPGGGGGGKGPLMPPRGGGGGGGPFEPPGGGGGGGGAFVVSLKSVTGCTAATGAAPLPKAASGEAASVLATRCGKLATAKALFAAAPESESDSAAPPRSEGFK